MNLNQRNIVILTRALTWDLCSGVDGGFGVFGSEPPAGVQCRSRARAVRSPSVTRTFYCFRFFAAAPRAASLIHPLARRLLPVELTFSLRCLSRVPEIHPPSLATGMIVREGIERFTNPLPRAADCVPRHLSTATFTIAHFLHPYTTLRVSFLPRLSSFPYLGTQIWAKCNKINHYREN